MNLEGFTDFPRSEIGRDFPHQRNQSGHMRRRKGRSSHEAPSAFSDGSWNVAAGSEQGIAGDILHVIRCHGKDSTRRRGETAIALQRIGGAELATLTGQYDAIFTAKAA